MLNIVVWNKIFGWTSQPGEHTQIKIVWMCVPAVEEHIFFPITKIWQTGRFVPKIGAKYVFFHSWHTNPN